jgi:hypothetical protein
MSTVLRKRRLRLLHRFGVDTARRCRSRLVDNAAHHVVDNTAHWCLGHHRHCIGGACGAYRARPDLRAVVPDRSRAVNGHRTGDPVGGARSHWHSRTARRSGEVRGAFAELTETEGTLARHPAIETCGTKLSP